MELSYLQQMQSLLHIILLPTVKALIKTIGEGLKVPKEV